MKKTLLAVCVLSLFLADYSNSPAQDDREKTKTYEEALKNFRANAGSDKPGVRAQAARDLSAATFPKKDGTTFDAIIALLEKELQNPEESVSGAVLDACEDALGRITDEKTIERLTKLAKDKKKFWRIRYYVIKALAKIGAANAINTVKELAGDENMYVRLAAVNALVEKNDSAFLSTLFQALKDSKSTWQVKISALKAVEKFAGEGNVQDLIAALRATNDSEGRVKDEIVKILKKITGGDEGFEPTAWENFWSAKKSGGNAKGAQVVAGTSAEAPPPPQRFFGIETKSTRIIYVVDISGSMAQSATSPELKEPDPEPPKKEKEKEVESGKKAGDNQNANNNPDPKKLPFGPDNPATWEGGKIDDNVRNRVKELKSQLFGINVTKKIEALKKELARSIYYLPPQAQFNIIFFSTGAGPWKDKFLKATWQNKLEALEAINSIGPTAMTNIFGAIEEGLKFVDEKKDPKKDKKKNDPKKNGGDDGATIGRGGGGNTTAEPSYIDPVGGPDTMYFLTDGMPTAGPFVGGGSYDKGGMLNEIKKIVELKPVIINTIGVGKDDEIDKDLLEQIAKITGGVFKHVKSQ